MIILLLSWPLFSSAPKKSLFVLIPMGTQIVLLLFLIYYIKPITLHLGNPYRLYFPLPSLPRGSCQKVSSKRIVCINPDLTWKKEQFWHYVTDSVKILPIYGFKHLSASWADVINICMFQCSEYDTRIK